MGNWASGFICIINYSFLGVTFTPPSETFFRLTDASEIRITDAGDNRITDS